VTCLTEKDIEEEEKRQPEARVVEVVRLAEEEVDQKAKPEANRRAELQEAKEGVVRLVGEEEDATSSTCFVT